MRNIQGKVLGNQARQALRPSRQLSSLESFVSPRGRQDNAGLMLSQLTRPYLLPPTPPHPQLWGPPVIFYRGQSNKGQSISLHTGDAMGQNRACFLQSPKYSVFSQKAKLELGGSGIIWEARRPWQVF